MDFYGNSDTWLNLPTIPRLACPISLFSKTSTTASVVMLSSQLPCPQGTSHSCYFLIITIKTLLLVLALSSAFSFYYENLILIYRTSYNILFHWSKFWFVLKIHLFSSYKNLLPEERIVCNKIYLRIPKKFLSSKSKSETLRGGLAPCSLFIRQKNCHSQWRCCGLKLWKSFVYEATPDIPVTK